MKLSAILDRLDEIEAKINEPVQDHVNGVHVSIEKEQGDQVFSDVADVFVGVRHRGKTLTFLHVCFAVVLHIKVFLKCHDFMKSLSIILKF